MSSRSATVSETCRSTGVLAASGPAALVGFGPACGTSVGSRTRGCGAGGGWIGGDAAGPRTGAGGGWLGAGCVAEGWATGLVGAGTGGGGVGTGCWATGRAGEVGGGGGGGGGGGCGCGICGAGGGASDGAPAGCPAGAPPVPSSTNRISSVASAMNYHVTSGCQRPPSNRWGRCAFGSGLPSDRAPLGVRPGSPRRAYRAEA